MKKVFSDPLLLALNVLLALPILIASFTKPRPQDASNRRPLGADTIRVRSTFFESNRDSDGNARLRGLADSETKLEILGI